MHHVFGWGFADPLASIIVAVLVLRSGYYVTKASIHVLMEGTPTNVETDKILQVITETEGVQDIHDLHIWTITSGLNARAKPRAIAYVRACVSGV